MKEFSARWSKSLWIMSALATLACAYPIFFRLTHAQSSLPSWISPLCLFIIAAAALSVVRAYTVSADSILIKRLLWTTRLPLEGLQSARIDPEALSGSLRIFGNGGFYSFTGWYWNKTLRTYQAFVTDPKRCVILKYPKRTIVLSPGTPEEFIDHINRKLFKV